MKTPEIMPITPQTFYIRGWETRDEEGRVLFHYGFDNGLEFCETIEFGHPLPAAASSARLALEAALDTLSVAMGTSYYKAFVPKELRIASLASDSNQIRFFKKLYVNGLAEFAYRNGIASLDYIELVSPGYADSPAANATLGLQ